MNTLTKTFVIAAGALVIACTPSIASAERIYFLVGTRHIYRIGPNRDADLQARIEIEKTYADKVANDQEQFQKAIDGGADKDKESEALNADLDAIAEDRDKSLGEIYERTDGVRDDHPELKIEGDGPYQLMGINVRMEGETMVFVNYAVYAPWPGYVVVGEPYGGWAFGVVYEPGVFYGRYHGWHDHFYHGERFHGGFYGHRGPVHFGPRGFVERHGPSAGPRGKYGESKPAGGGSGKYGGGSSTSSSKGKYGGSSSSSPSTGKYGGGSSNSTSVGKYSGGVKEKTPPNTESPSETKTTGTKYGSGSGTSTTKYGGDGGYSSGSKTGTSTYKSPTGTSTGTSTGTGKTTYKTTTSTYSGTKVSAGGSSTKPGGSTGTGSFGSNKSTSSSTSKFNSTPAKAPVQKSAPSAPPKKKGK